MNQPDAAIHTQHMSFADVRRRWLPSELAGGGWTFDKAVWICLAVAGLSLFSAYVLVLQDAVRNGKVVRATLAQPLVKPTAAATAAPGSDPVRLAAAPTPR